MRGIGHIELPAVRLRPNNPLSRRVRPAPALIDQTPIEVPLGQLRPVELAQVRRTADEGLFNSLMEEHHYLGYEQPVGEHLKSLVSGYKSSRINWLPEQGKSFSEADA